MFTASKKRRPKTEKNARRKQRRLSYESLEQRLLLTRTGLVGFSFDAPYDVTTSQGVNVVGDATFDAEFTFLNSGDLSHISLGINSVAGTGVVAGSFNGAPTTGDVDVSVENVDFNLASDNVAVVSMNATATGSFLANIDQPAPDPDIVSPGIFVANFLGSINLTNGQVAGNLDLNIKTDDNAIDEDFIVPIAALATISPNNFVLPNPGEGSISGMLWLDGNLDGQRDASESLQNVFVLDNAEPALVDGLNNGDTITVGGVDLAFQNVVVADGSSSGEVEDEGILLSSTAEAFNDVLQFDFSFSEDVKIETYDIGLHESIPLGSFFTITGPNGTSGENTIPQGSSTTESTFEFKPGTIPFFAADEVYTFTHNLPTSASDPFFDLEEFAVARMEPDLRRSGAVVELRDSTTDALVSSATTNRSGGYSFIDVDPGDYILQVTNLPRGNRLTLQDTGDDATDSDVNPASLKSNPITVGAGQNHLNIDGGVIPGSAFQNLRNRHDIDGDGSFTLVDAFKLVAHVRNNGTGIFGSLPNSKPDDELFVDVDGTGTFSLVDVFDVIDATRRFVGNNDSAGEGEGEASRRFDFALWDEDRGFWDDDRFLF